MLAAHSATATNGYGPVALATVLGGLGVGLSTPTATNSVMSALPEEKFGVGAGINDTTREVGGAIGVAVLNAVLAAAYTRNLPAAVLDGPPPEMRSAAENNLGAALVVADRLPDPGPLRHAPTEAFVSAMHTGLLVAAAACFAGALASDIIIGRRRVARSVLGGAVPETPGSRQLSS